MTKERIIGHLAAAFTIFVWGITFINTKYLVDFFTPIDIMAIRYVVAYISLFIISPKILKFQGWKKEGYLFVAAMSGGAVYQYLENLAVYYTSPASVSFITALSPVFTVIVAHMLYSEKLNFQIMCGMFISLVGVFFITFGDSQISETGLLGDLIILGGVWLWTVYSVVIKKIADFGLAQIQISRRIFLYSLIFIVPYATFTPGKISMEYLMMPSSIINLAFLSVIASAICFCTWNKGVIAIGPTAANKYMFVMPIITLLGQVVYNKDQLGIIAVLGMFLILSGLAVTETDFKRLKKEMQ